MHRGLSYFVRNAPPFVRTVCLCDYTEVMVWVFSLGGSLVAPKDCDDLVDGEFLQSFYALVQRRIAGDERFIIIVGGGCPARTYQNAYTRVRSLFSENNTQRDETMYHDALDRIGIAATHLNAALVREIFSEHAESSIVTNPEADDIVFVKSILIGAGWKPGFSTDLDAVLLAKRFGAKTIVNISNIAQIYTADPACNPKAKPLRSIRWDEMMHMVGTQWKPGMNVPFDPVACKEARDAVLEVISVGSSLDNVEAVLDGKNYVGTRIW